MFNGEAWVDWPLLEQRDVQRNVPPGLVVG